MSNSIVLIDFSSIAHPIFHTSANEPDPNAMSTAIVAKVRALASGQPHVALCLDSRKSFRKDVDATYKAGRESKPEAFFHQCRTAIEILRGDGFPTWEAEGFEADDVIASACMASCKSSAEVPMVLIISADKDLLQLVDGAVSVKNPISGNVMDPAAVQEKFGVAPNQMGDYLAIVGDTSDNVVGVKGIGAKGAAALLQTFGTLDNLYTALDKGEASIKPAQLLALNEFKPRLPVVRQLLTLRTDAPVNFDEILRERVPVDVAVFGGEDDLMADLNEAMPTAAPFVADSRPPGETTTGHELTGAQATDALGAFAADVARRVAPKSLTPYEQAQEYQQQIIKENEAKDPAPAQPAMTPAAESARSRVDRAVDASVVSHPIEALATVSFERQLEPRTISEAKDLSNWMFQSRMFGAYGTPQAVLSTMLAGRELGLSAMASLRAFHIIENRPTLSADLIRALVLKSGKAKYFRCTERTAERATFETQRGDDPPISLTYTVEEAKAAGTIKPGSGWTKNPSDMCVARASSKLARLVYSDIVFNLYSDAEFD